VADVERTRAGLQMIIPGCERRTLPKSTTRVDEIGQGLLHFYKRPKEGSPCSSAGSTRAAPPRSAAGLPKVVTSSANSSESQNGASVPADALQDIVQSLLNDAREPGEDCGYRPVVATAH
jgi:hypothetical protein